MAARVESLSALSLPSWHAPSASGENQRNVEPSFERQFGPRSPSMLAGANLASLPANLTLDFSPDMRGFILKRRGGVLRRKWVEEDFLIKNDLLIVCSPENREIEECVPLTNIAEVRQATNNGFIVIHHAATKKGKMEKTELHCRAASPAERDEWCGKLQKLITVARNKSEPLGNFIGRERAEKVIQTAYTDLRNVAGRALSAYVALFSRFKDDQNLRMAFASLRPPAKVRDFELKTTAPPAGDAYEGFRLKPSEHPPRGEPKPRFNQIRKAALLEIRLRSLERNSKFRAMNALMANALTGFVADRRVSDRVTTREDYVQGAKQPSSVRPESAGALTSARGGIGSGGSMSLSPEDEKNSSAVMARAVAFMTMSWRAHAQEMARSVVLWRKTKLAVIFDGLERRRLREGFDKIKISGLFKQQKKNQQEEMLSLLLFSKARAELLEKRQIFDCWRQMNARRHQLDGVVRDLLINRRKTLCAFAVRQWYMTCVKRSALDLTAVTQIFNIVKKVQFKDLLHAFRTFQKHTILKVQDESLQVAANLSLMNSKIIASFNQVPQHRATLKFHAVLCSARRSRLMVGLSSLRYHAAQTRLYFKAVESLKAFVHTLQAKYLLQKPFHVLLAYSHREALQSSQRELSASTIHRSCDLLSSLIRSKERASGQLALASLKRAVLVQKLQQEKDQFLDAQKKILARGNLSNHQVFAEKTALWFEKCRHRRLLLGWRALSAAFESSSILRSIVRMQLTQRVVQLLDRQRVVVLAYAWQRLKYHLKDCVVEIESRKLQSRKALHTSELAENVINLRSRQRQDMLRAVEDLDEDSSLPERSWSSPTPKDAESPVAIPPPAEEEDLPVLQKLFQRKSGRTSQKVPQLKAYKSPAESSEASDDFSESVKQVLNRAERFLESGSSKSSDQGLVHNQSVRGQESTQPTTTILGKVFVEKGFSNNQLKQTRQQPLNQSASNERAQRQRQSLSRQFPHNGLPRLRGSGCRDLEKEEEDDDEEDSIDFQEINQLLRDFSAETKNQPQRGPFWSFNSGMETNDGPSGREDLDILRDYLEDALSDSSFSFWPESSHGEQSNERQMVAQVRRIVDARGRTAGEGKTSATEFTFSKSMTVKIATVRS